MSDPNGRKTKTDFAYVLFLDTDGFSQYPADQQQVIVQELHLAAQRWGDFNHLKQEDNLTFNNSGDGYALVFF
jgi:hypothetical protein